MLRALFLLYIGVILYCPIVSAQVERPVQNLNAYDIKFYGLDLTVDNLSPYINGSVTVKYTWLRENVDTLVLELNELAVIDSVFIESKPAQFAHTSDYIFIPISHSTISDTLKSVTIFYSLQLDPGIEAKGLYNARLPNGKGVTWTLSEPFASKIWFPCKQDLTDKADSVFVFLTMADSLKGGSNGLLTKVLELSGNRVQYQWESHYPTAYYLISLSVANYLDYSFYAQTGEEDSVLVQNFIYNDSSYFQSHKDLIDATANMIKVFSEKIMPYPFRREKYGHCLAPIGGGMEHQTMTTLNGFHFDLVSHELFHQWFGDYVTCSDWQNIWLNEGFASYGEYIAIENLIDSSAAKEWLELTHSIAKTKTNGGIYLTPEEALVEDRIFDYALTYRKGASIIHMIRHELQNDELFYRVLSTFLSRFANSVATASDFEKVLEEISGKDFTQFFAQWYYGEGYPKLSLSWEQKHDTLKVYFNQTTTTPDKTPFFEILLDLKINYFGGDTLLSFRQMYSLDTFVFAMPSVVWQLNADPNNWLLMDIVSVNRIIPNIHETQFNIFPNPAQNELFIENYEPGKPFTVKIYDINGIQRINNEGFEVFTAIDISKLTPGIYEVVTVSNRKKEIFKMIKTRS